MSVRAVRTATFVTVAGASAAIRSVREAPVLTLESVSRCFRNRIVVSDLNLTALRGERIALQGENGVGKTTVLRMIAGTLRASSGKIWIGAAPAGSLEARSQLGVCLTQGRGFYGRLSGRDNLLLFARFRMQERSARAAVAALEEELELQEIAAVRVDRCSAGMLGQLAFARTLLGDPSLLLLDEPTRSLDDDGRGRMWSAIDRRPSLTVLIATHLDDDLDLATRTLQLGQR
jgi:ABC-2 type transport system ATP-binding protein